MKFEELVSAWGSPDNAPAPASIDDYKAQLARRLGKEYRDFLWVIGLAAGITIFLVGAFAQYLRGGGAFDAAREWGSIAFLLLPIGLALLFVRGYVLHRRRHPRYDLSILAAVRAALDANRLSRLRLRVSMGVMTVAMALTPLITHQLQAVGKQRPHEAMSMLAVFGVGYVIAMVAQVWLYRGKLAPEGARLRRMLASYEGNS